MNCAGSLSSHQQRTLASTYLYTHHLHLLCSHSEQSAASQPVLLTDSSEQKRPWIAAEQHRRANLHNSERWPPASDSRGLDDASKPEVAFKRKEQRRPMTIKPFNRLNQKRSTKWVPLSRRVAPTALLPTCTIPVVGLQHLTEDRGFGDASLK